MREWVGAREVGWEGERWERIERIICRETEHGSRISRARESCAGNREFSSQSSQTNDLKMYTCRFLVKSLGLQ